MKKVFPIMLSVLCLASCTKTGDNKSFYLAKYLDTNSKIEFTNTHVEKVNDFLTDSIKSVTDINTNDNLVFSPLSYYISLASIYGLTYSNSSLDKFLSKTNLSSKEEIKDYVRTIMTNSNMEQKYDENNTKQIKLKLNLKTDKDILDKLNSVDNKQGYIKKLIREDIGDNTFT